MQIINGDVFLVPPARIFQTRARTTQLQIESLALRYELPDVDLMLYTSDVCQLQLQPAPYRSHDENFERCPQLVSLLMRLWTFSSTSHYIS